LKSETAVNNFSNGYNCAQSVFLAFCEEYGLEGKTALKLTCGLGGGFRSGELCGAVSGAVLAIGLKDGQFDLEDNESKALCHSKMIGFIDQFREQFSSITCKDLLGYDISTEEGKAQHQHGKPVCTEMVKRAAELLVELGY